MAEDVLTVNAVPLLFVKSVCDFKPTVQIVGVKRAKKCGALSKLDIVILYVSDGRFALVACTYHKELSNMVRDGSLRQNTVVQIERYRLAPNNNNYHLFISDIAVLFHCDQTLGSPQRLGKESVKKLLKGRSSTLPVAPPRDNNILTPNAVLLCYIVPRSRHFAPVVQITAFKSATSRHCCKMLVSDGTQFTTVLSYGPDIHKMMTEGDVKKYTVVRIESFKCVTVSCKPVLLVLRITVISHPARRLGNPCVVYEELIKLHFSTTNRT